MLNPLKHLTARPAGRPAASGPARPAAPRSPGARRAGGAIAVLASAALVASCGTTTATSGGSSGSGTTISSAVRQASIGASAADILAANADTSEAAAAATSADSAGAYDSSAATIITASGSSVKVSGTGTGNVTTDGADGATATITGSGTYVVSGTLDDGQIVVDADDADVRLVLAGTSITNADGPAIDIQDAGSAVMVLAEGTTNTLADGPAYADTGEDAATAALYSSDTLTITGTGSLDVTGSYKDGISSKNGLGITGGPTITVNAADDGVRGKDYLLVSSGRLTVTAGDDGLKSSEDDDETKGFVALGAAAVTVVSGDDGVSATTDVTVDGTTLSITAGGGQASATVSDQGPGQGGPERGAPGQDQSAGSAEEDSTPSPKGINAGVAYAQDSGSVTIDAADEGLQGAFVNVNGGSLDIASGDDGVNASNGDSTIEGYESADSESDDGSALTISGGQVQIDYASSDGIDSNGSAHVTGGEVVVGGAAGAMDGSVDANGETTLVGVSASLAVAEGDTITVTSADGTSWTLTSRVSADAVTVLGLSEGVEYTVSTTSGGSTTATASALSAGMGGGPGGPGGPGDQGGPEGGQAPGQGGPGPKG
ncbi:carbohydrate-binding domain-containing protein [Actinomyces israelii]|uniref:carbohydrate-binding domain-containing protein n=1 Tax=Actinomyces israelii TaxID=1659 RepID=UPI0005BD16A6|nr:carbohydrate-binding domain-containing protein [Actinomyces israelii]